MTHAPWDADRAAANTPGVPAHVLAEIAGRRWDLHAEIAANPSAHPELVRWMLAVNPGLGRPPQPTWSAPAAASWPGSVPPPPPRRGGAGCWWAGCGCLAIVAFLVIIVLVIVGIGAALGPSNDQPPTAGEGATDPSLQEQVELFEQERVRIDELSAVLVGNPVASLVADFEWYALQLEKMADPGLSLGTAQAIVTQTTQFRVDLEASIAAAETRRTNATGSTSERLVDEAGNGFIDIRWDADTACAASEREGWRTSGCVKGSDSLTVHLRAEADFTTEWAMLMTVVHEIAHVYQHADRARFWNYEGVYDSLLAQGLFQGSSESMADCFSLAFFNEWKLSDGRVQVGYGYVCTESERQAIRDWEAGLRSSMTG